MVEMKDIITNRELAYELQTLNKLILDNFSFPLCIINLITEYSFDTVLGICGMFKIDSIVNTNYLYDYVRGDIIYHFEEEKKLTIFNMRTDQLIKEYALKNMNEVNSYYIYCDQLIFLSISKSDSIIKIGDDVSIKNICNINIQNYEITYGLPNILSLIVLLPINGSIMSWVVNKELGILYIYKNTNNAYYIQKLDLVSMKLLESKKIKCTCRGDRFLFNSSILYFIRMTKDNDLIVRTYNAESLKRIARYIIFESDIITSSDLKKKSDFTYRSFTFNNKNELRILMCCGDTNFEIIEYNFHKRIIHEKRYSFIGQILPILKFVDFNICDMDRIVYQSKFPNRDR